jgi:hypothetical protein
MRCLACRRALRNPVSLKHGFGPDCLRKAVKAGTLGIEALTELSSEQRETKRRPRIKPAPVADIRTPDLFDMLRLAALDDLRKAVTACASVGVVVTYQIED